MSAVARRLATLLRWHRAIDNSSLLGNAGKVAVVPRGYHTFDDPAEVGIAIRELRRTFNLISQFADVAAEAVDVPPERAVGIRATTALVMELIRRAETRQAELVGPAKVLQQLCDEDSRTEPLARGGSIA